MLVQQILWVLDSKLLCLDCVAFRKTINNNNYYFFFYLLFLLLYIIIIIMKEEKRKPLY